MTRILLVDDDEDHLMLFTMILEKQGFTLDTYSDPIVALSHFKSNCYDLAVIDYVLPNLWGLELYKRLRDIDSTIKALILTASHEELNKLENPLQDHLNFMGKPITAERLLGEIDSILKQVTTPVLDRIKKEFLV